MEDKAKLLFVDDEVRIVNLLKMMFRSTYDVFTATSGQEAMEIIKSQRIDVIISDQRMPEMLGIELLKNVREASPNTMRILLTGYSDLAAIIGAVNEGEVYRFVNKPWDQEEIKTIVAEASEIAMTIAKSAPAPTQPVMSTAAQPNNAKATSNPKGNTLLVLDEDPAQREEIMQMFKPEYSVLGAESIEAALKHLEHHNIGVIVSEARVGGQDTGPLLRTLKQHYPLITTVMLTSSADSDLVIKLINQAQIYRFATKPIRHNVVKLAVAAAMKEHHRFCATPLLMARHRVNTPDTDDSTGYKANIIKSLLSLRSRLPFLKVS